MSPLSPTPYDVGVDDELVREVEGLVRRWLDVAATKPVDPAARQLAAVLKDPAGLDFTVGFVDRVIRPEDPRVAAQSLRELARTTPRFLPWHLRAGVRLGAAVSAVAPGLVIPVVRRVLRHMVGHLLIDATDSRLGKAIARLRQRDVRLNVNLLGEAVLGEKEADRRLEGTRRLLARDDVDYVSIKVSATVAPHSPWAFDEAVAHIEKSLLPLFQLAAQAPTPKFINLDMEEYRDLDLTIAVFTRLLDRPELTDLEAGIVLQAYLPDALAAMQHLQEWAAKRRARGGAAIKVRVVKGANLPMERVEATLHGWPLATWSTKQESDTNYKRVLGWAMTPERLENVRLGIAGHNLFDVAYAWVLAGRRGVRDGIEFEMLLGMAEGQAAAVKETVGGLLLYTPVVHPREFDVAIAYLVRRLEEGASQDNFMSAVFDLHDDSGLFARERARFVASLEALDDTVPSPNRTQDRRKPVDETPPTEFANTPDTDPSLPGNREWARVITQRVATSTRGDDLVAAHLVTDADALDRIVADAAASGWGDRTGAERAVILRRAVVELERRRADLLEVMASECGKTLDQGDPEVSEAIDFAAYYAGLAEDLDRIDGAVAHPVRVTVVTPPWNFPVAIPAGSTLAALAAGSSVVVKPATQARRCGSVMVEALWAAGVPREALRLVHVEESDLGRQLIAHPAVDRLILTGAFETAELFRSFRPDLPLMAETSGKNALVVTPHADLDLAVKDLVASAFGHAGQKCSAASLGILVGSVATSRRFREQLVDAVSSLKVGYPSDPTSQMGPIIEPASGKLARALTTLGPGEQWLVEPRLLDADAPDGGRLWSPGVKTGVRRGSEYHLTEYFGPVLGLMTAESLEEAVAIQNEVEYGLTAGLHSFDRDEIAQWLATVEAGNLYVNRGITGAIVRRQPFGGWKKSSVGAGTKAGGPSYLIGLSDWATAPATTTADVDGAPQRLLAHARGFLDEKDAAYLARALGSDAAVWTADLGVAKDVTGLEIERNVLRHLPVPAWIRLEAGSPAELLRVVGAGLRTGAPMRVSTAEPLPEPVTVALRDVGVTPVVEDAAAWRDALAGLPAGRVRLIGGDPVAFATATGGRPELALYAQPVVEAGRVELLTFVHEQAVAVTAHRFGTPTTLVDGLL
ncbi:bifunctional proline dehydrogenase/L-glutamate gamma-semialdehyde dehydrogenase [Mumia quercus]|uniref:bifunctional proline dehydrogenase/L-glutamate gamma-semialdehyde dehydrogenase n=1 Tax=Mumia quercus TaxID=2976125 RepID=UPI0021D39734|nr:bifunctional proline dehydrogenase/L-glutamate gamma-semialdehyde dehydrogenase [Mumia quercus]